MEGVETVDLVHKLNSDRKLVLLHEIDKILLIAT